MKNIFIIGAGAIGKVLAVILTLQKKQVVVLRGSADNVIPFDEFVEVKMPDGTALKSAITISSLSNYETLDGIVVLTTKAFGNTALAGNLKGKTANCPIVVLQNGLNVEAAFLEDFAAVYRCVLFATSQIISPGELRFKPVSVSPVGILKGNRSELDQIVAAIDSNHFRFSASDDIQHIVWKKVIANCVFNSICPLIDADNGIFYRNSEALNLAKAVIRECTAIARAEKINVNEDEILETVLLISKSSDGQLISTLQDIRNGRETEIESLNFAIVKIAQQHNLQHLVPTTLMLGQLVRLRAAK